MAETLTRKLLAGHLVSAPHAGVVQSLPFDEGSLVLGGAVLVEVQET